MHRVQAVISMTLPTNDIVYDSVSDRILVSVPSSAGPLRGNSITPIDPHTGVFGTSVFAASEPTIFALADDGSRVYVASNATNYVTPFSLSTMTPGAPFAIGGVDRRVDDMEVPPGHGDSLVVSRRVLGQSPRGAGIAVYVNGVQLPRTSSDSAIDNVIEFGTSSAVLYGHANEISERDFNTIQINLSPTGGYIGDTQVKNMLTGGGLDMEFDNGRMYFTNGQVVNPSIPRRLAYLAPLVQWNQSRLWGGRFLSSAISSRRSAKRRLFKSEK